MNKQKTHLDFNKYFNTQELREQVKKVKQLSSKLQEIRPHEVPIKPELICSETI